MKSLLLFAILISPSVAHRLPDHTSNGVILFKNFRLIDGNGGIAVDRAYMLVKNGKIEKIGRGNIPTTGSIVDLGGKAVMPCLISVHTHIGTLRGTSNKSENYTRDNILSQLKKYQAFGVSNILVMGSDRPMLFNRGLRDSSQKGLIPGARIFSAGYGFGAPQGVPPVGFGFDLVYRPVQASQVKREMDSLVKVRPTLVKLWLDDFGGQFKKMPPAIYQTIIREAHRRGLRVAAHVYYLSDARNLVRDSVDIFAHSVRDSIIDDGLIAEMKKRRIQYIPTLSLDEFAFIYAQKPSWINDEFFRASLEPGVYEMITSEKYQNDLKNSPAYARNIKGLETAIKNLKKLFDAGILICMGTDSGAQPVRAQGFSEHLELELMVQAGLSPLQAITAATKNAATLLRSQEQYGTLEPGKNADVMVLDEDPLRDIRNTRKILSVYNGGKKVSSGPLKN